VQLAERVMLACKEVRLKASAYRRCLAMARLQPLPPDEEDDEGGRDDGRRGRKRKSKAGATKVTPERSLSPEAAGDGDGPTAAPRAAARGPGGPGNGGGGGMTTEVEDLMQRWAVEIKPKGSDKVRTPHDSTALASSRFY